MAEQAHTRQQIEIIQHPDTLDPARDLSIYDVRSDTGLIVAIYRATTGIYLINDFDVFNPDDRGKGYGRELLNASYQHARTTGARAIMAHIISRECLESMRRVFGDETLRVSQEGGFAPAGTDTNRSDPTRAVLWKPLMDPIFKQETP